MRARKHAERWPLVEVLLCHLSAENYESSALTWHVTTNLVPRVYSAFKMAGLASKAATFDKIL